MTDMKVSALHVLAGVHWVVGLALVLLDVLTDAPTGTLGLFLGMAGATINIRTCLWYMEIRLGEREQSAFNLGRDSIRSVR